MIDQFRPAVLRVLADGQVCSVSQICAEAAQYLKLSESAMAEILSSEQLRYRNRTNWACSSLSKAGLVSKPERGLYQIAQDGRTVDARNLTSYSEKDLLEWPRWQEYQQEIAERKASEHLDSVTVPVNADYDPIEQTIELARIHNASTETELRTKLQEGTPTFFEKAVVDLLWAMGYGGPHGEREHLGKSGDGGIDGVIRQDALGLNKVYVQAKRYADDNHVGRPAIQQFYGSLSSRGADRGVFITTSRYSDEAKRAAEDYKTVILIDGIRLTKLMLEYRVGVQPVQHLTLFEVDEDYFESELD
ncbi:restriction endonuclease [Corynebacterium gerontici]|uniref:Mrr restriction system protein n=1 Tax=Corynebacterium gerontici TaxID=2079234 RepID=A0A3G6IYD5_9CORY|nr:restriction endonuclease [Corynebacterium gerontici]AZA10795.1 Mrr restriction system protein [Corynebacterium gerontici]